MTNPAIVVLKAEREKSAAEVDRLVLMLRDARAALRSFDDAIATLEGRPDSVPTPTGSVSLRDLVHSIIKASNGITAGDVTSAVVQSGRNTDHNTVLGTLSRLRRDRLIHKEEKLWLDGAGDDAEPEDVEPEIERAPTEVEAPLKVGDEAELDDQGALQKSKVAQHPIANRESVGSKPTVSAPLRRDLLAGAAFPVVPTQPKPPWLR